MRLSLLQRNNINKYAKQGELLTHLLFNIKERSGRLGLMMSSSTSSVASTTTTTTTPPTTTTHDIEDLHKAACLNHLDSYIDPLSGYSCFTQYFFMKRGKCCGSACRHCPYEHQNVVSLVKKNKNNNKTTKMMMVTAAVVEGGDTTPTPTTTEAAEGSIEEAEIVEQRQRLRVSLGLNPPIVLDKELTEEIKRFILSEKQQKEKQRADNKVRRGEQTSEDDEEEDE